MLPPRSAAALRRSVLPFVGASALLTFGLVLARPLGVHAPTAQGQAANNEVDEWFQDLLLEGGGKGDVAAFELFTRQVQPKRLREIMADASQSKARLCILRALKFGGRLHPRAAFSLALLGLGDKDQKVHDAATRALGFLEDPFTYQAIGRELHTLRHARPETLGGRKARGLIDGIERLRYPMPATAVLITVLNERMETTLERYVTQALERMTAQRFSRAAQWQAWWKTVQERRLTPSEWRHEVVRRRYEAQSRLERRASEFYARLIAALQDKPQRLLAELERGLAEERIPGICGMAIDELGRLGRLSEASSKPNPEREQAVRLLVARLKRGSGAEHDPIKALVLEALGRTRDPALLGELQRFLHHDAPLMRVAAVKALAALGSKEAIGPVLEQLNHKDAQLVREAILALGQIGVDAVVDKGPPVERVSDRLVTHCMKILGSNGKAAPSASTLLGIAARALGMLRQRQSSPRVVELLTELAEHKSRNVRYEAVSALATLPDAAAFAALGERFKLEQEGSVRKEILGSIGRQARGNVAYVGSAVEVLVPLLFSTRREEAALRQESQDALLELASVKDFVGLGAVVAEIDERDPTPRREAVRLSFLRLLPEPDSERVGKLNPAVRRRYFLLVVRRGQTLLAQDPVAALEDFRAARNGLGLQTVGALDEDSLHVYLGEAQALLAVPQSRPKEAFGIAEACLKLKQSPATWDVTFSALEALKDAKSPDLPALIQRIAPYVEKGTAKERERFEALKRPGKTVKKPSSTVPGS